jgi:hypothetical protein
MADIEIYDVIKDGACLYRCMAKYLYDNCNKIGNNPLGVIDQTEYTFEYETILARKIQELLVEWVLNNREKYDMDMLIEVCHSMTIETYREIYKIFAGDNDYIYEETDKRYKTGKRKGEIIYNKVYIPTRWGGYPEQIAFSELFGVCINIYTLRQRRTNYINTDNIKHIMSIGKGHDVNFLLTETKASHYMYIEINKGKMNGLPE